MKKTKVIPGVNAKTFTEIVEKINALRGLTSEFHLDAATEPFANTTTWKNFSDLKKLPEDLRLDIHLMLPFKPPDVLAWAEPNVKRFIFHLEILNNPAGVIRIAKKTKREVYLALSPNIEAISIEPFLKFVNGVLVLGVQPGKTGQSLLPETYKQLEWTKAKLTPKQKLMVDGGINEQNFRRMLEYKPDCIILASAIYGYGDACENFRKFSQLATLSTSDVDIDIGCR